MKIKKALKAQGGFTLIEMLIVVAIIAILVAVSIPMMNNALEDARNSTDMANVRAAKAWAMMDFMKGEKASVVKITSPATEVKVYYKASTGECVAGSSAGEKYGKSKKAITDSTADSFGLEIPEGKDIELTVKNDGTIKVAWK